MKKIVRRERRERKRKKDLERGQAVWGWRGAAISFLVGT
jgi:hypothetical protein